MIVKSQKEIKFINDCDCIVDEKELAAAILWYQHRPTVSIKHIYMHGCYPAISIHKQKIHIHRLLMLYWNNGKLPTNKQVHHKNGNKKDASFDNLTFIDAGVHQSFHNKGKTLPPQVRAAIIRCNHLKKGKRAKPHRQDITTLMVYNLHEKGMSFNEISKKFNLNWECVKQRYKDAIHDKKELLKKEE